MTLSPLLRAYLRPQRAAVLFALKGVLAMGIALLITMWMGFDRPYWAMLSAVFLQMRPESGMVIQKGLYQLSGTIIGGTMGLIVLAFGLQAPGLALGLLGTIFFVLATLSARTHDFNVTYFYAMTAVTAGLVVLITKSSAPTSDGAFTIAVSRVSEIGIGAICATVSSLVLWPVETRPRMVANAHDALKKALVTVQAHLPVRERALDTRHEAVLSALDAIITLEADTGPTFYEGLAGPYRAQAAHVMSQRTLSLVSDATCIGQWPPEELNQAVHVWLDRLSQSLDEMQQLDDASVLRERLMALRHEILGATPAFEPQGEETPYRARKALLTLLGHLVVLCDACTSVEHPHRSRLRANPPMPYHDLIPSMVVGLRTTLLFACTSAIWLLTGWGPAIMMMVMPLVLSMMFSQLPRPPVLIGFALKGGLLAFPVAIVFGGVLLANAPHVFESLWVIFGLPMFIALLGFASPMTLPYSLGFCLVYIIMTMPSNHMNFDVAASIERGMAVLMGFVILKVMFTSIKVPGAASMQRRLFNATVSDLAALRSRRTEAEQFNSRMMARLKELGSYERVSDARLPWHWVEQGLTALTIGHQLMRVRGLMRARLADPAMRIGVRLWQSRVADAYRASAAGQFDEASFNREGRTMLGLLEAARVFEENDLARVRFLVERMRHVLSRQHEHAPE